MNRLLSIFLACAIAVTGAGAGDAFAQGNSSRDEQGAARQQMQAGNVLPLREIERRVLPQMKGMRYLGPSYDAVAMAYRLRFEDGGRVHFVDVDARSGRIISRSR